MSDWKRQRLESMFSVYREAYGKLSRESMGCQVEQPTCTLCEAPHEPSVDPHKVVYVRDRKPTFLYVSVDSAPACASCAEGMSYHSDAEWACTNGECSARGEPVSADAWGIYPMRPLR